VEVRVLSGALAKAPLRRGFLLPKRAQAVHGWVPLDAVTGDQPNVVAAPPPFWSWNAPRLPPFIQQRAATGGPHAGVALRGWADSSRQPHRALRGHCGAERSLPRGPLPRYRALARSLLKFAPPPRFSGPRLAGGRRAPRPSVGSGDPGTARGADRHRPARRRTDRCGAPRTTGGSGAR